MRAFKGRRGALALALGISMTQAGAADEPRLADYFGFLPLEVYKLDTRIGNLTIRDLDGDKVDDIAVANNARSRIDLLLSGKKPGGDDAPPLDKKEVNQVGGDRRMRLASVAVNKAVVSLQAGDFDGDGRADLAYFGEPAGIEILINRGDGRFGDPKRINVGEAVEAPGALSVGDFDKDGRDDLALIGKDEIILIYQKEKGKLGEPERLPHTLGNPRMVKAVDLDGDGVDDLVMLNGGADDPIRVRFAAEKGTYGPEERFFVEPLRAYAFAAMDARPGSELLMIEDQSGRARVLTLDDDEEDAGRGRLSFYPLPGGDAQGRSLGVGDLDGDGRPEVVVTDPAKARFLVHRRSGKGALGAGKTFPSLVGGGPVALADLDGDGKAEVYVLSEKERQIGRSLMVDGRLTFPSPLPTRGDPVALAVADLDGDRRPEVVYVTRDKAEGSTADLFTLRALAVGAPGKFVDKGSPVPIKGLGGVPPRLVVTDFNRDGHPDVLVFDLYGPPHLLIGQPGGDPSPSTGGLGPLADVAPAGLTLADLGGPALLAAQQHAFARKLRLDKDGGWAVEDQYDSGRPGGQVQGVAALDTDGDGVKEIALLERTSKSLLFLTRKEGVYTPSGKLSVGPFEDFQGMHVADFDGDGRDDLLLAGTSRFGVVLTGQKDRKFRTLAGYESARDEAKFGDLAAGDLNGDGRPDVVLTDVAEHFLEIATFDPGQPDLARAAAFKVFERKTRRNIGEGIEPRDMAIGDVDGDGRADLVLIVHDRILVYRQDPGKEKEPVKAAGGK